MSIVNYNRKERMTNMREHLSLIFNLEAMYMQSHHLPHRLRPGSLEKWLALLVLGLMSLILARDKSDKIVCKFSLAPLNARVRLHLMIRLTQLFLTNCYRIQSQPG